MSTAPLAIVDFAKIVAQPASLDIWDSKYRLKDRDGVPLDDSIDDTWRRVARALADVELTPGLREQWYEMFLWALRHGAIPAGRIVSNAGASNHKPATSTINCTVSGTIHDSMDDILRKVHEAGLTLKAGSGIGYDFSTLRPRGAYVAGAGAQTSGPLSFMDIYDRMCMTVSSAGGRRGAQMATFDIGHPDVLDFIRAKREDGRLRQFNLSLLVSDEFMRAVHDDADWPLVFPLSAAEARAEAIEPDDNHRLLWRDWPLRHGYLTDGYGRVACRILRTVRARELWDLVMRSTYDYAEPGVIFSDRVNEDNNNWFCEDLRATNPCVTADTWIHTAQGPRQVRDLIGVPFAARVDGTDHASSREGFFRTGRKEIVRLETDAGHALRLTADHRLQRVRRFTPYRTETEWCAAVDLMPGDRVLLNDHRSKTEWPGPYTFEQGYLIGLLVGDGVLKTDDAVLSVWHATSVVNSDNVSVNAGASAVMAVALRAARTLPHRADFRGWCGIPGRNEYRLKLRAIKVLAEELGMRQGHKVITAALERGSSAFCRGFLRGLFDTDGSVQGTQQKGVSVRLAQSDLSCLQAVQRILLRLGIAATIYINRRHKGTTMLPDGNGGRAIYPVKAQHELVISGENLTGFHEQVGFADSDKATRLTSLLISYKRALNRERFTARVRAVTAAGIEDVYDAQIPGIHAFDANGLHAHNCGEQPLPPYGSCLLGSVNLTRFVREPFSERARFDWEQYRQVVRIFTRMLDNVVELHGLPLPQQADEIRRKRRHGMGFLGLGSALTMLRLKYGEPASLDFTGKVTREMAVTGWEVALELAQEKGPAPIMEENFHVSAAMLRRRPDLHRDGLREGDRVAGRVLHARYSRYMQRLAGIAPDLVEALARVGARYSHHTSIAPTGTISLSLANNASNGIEPSFAHHYVRNVIRAGRKTRETLDVYSCELLAYRGLVNPRATPGSERDSERLPDYFVTAADITPRQHVDIQAAAQRWVDSSISKTANVPTDYPFADFRDIYHYAYEQGLKGCTTFRFNPEAFQGVLVRKSDLENTVYRFVLEDGTAVEVRGNEEIEYDGGVHTAANLFDALKEGYYGRY